MHRRRIGGEWGAKRSQPGMQSAVGPVRGGGGLAHRARLRRGQPDCPVSRIRAVTSSRSPALTAILAGIPARRGTGPERMAVVPDCSEQHRARPSSESHRHSGQCCEPWRSGPPIRRSSGTARYRPQFLRSGQGEVLRSPDSQHSASTGPQRGISVGSWRSVAGQSDRRERRSRCVRDQSIPEPASHQGTAGTRAAGTAATEAFRSSYRRLARHRRFRNRRPTSMPRCREQAPRREPILADGDPDDGSEWVVAKPAACLRVCMQARWRLGPRTASDPRQGSGNGSA